MLSDVIARSGKQLWASEGLPCSCRAFAAFFVPLSAETEELSALEAVARQPRLRIGDAAWPDGACFLESGFCEVEFALREGP